jgi:RNA polymerase-associated protein CTR9
MTKLTTIRSIEIPTRDGSEVVEVFLDELPNDANEICDILEAESAPLKLFHEFALEYYNRGDGESFERMLRRGLAEFTRDRRSTDSLKAASRMNSALAAQKINEAACYATSDRARAAAFLDEATDYLNRAEERISAKEDNMLWARKGLLMLARGSWEAANYQFKIALDKQPENIAALLGQSAAYFYMENYRAALGGFQNVLRLAPHLNDVRAAIGYCFYRLGFLDYAARAFARALEVDASHDRALDAFAFLQLRDPATLSDGLVRFKAAYQRNRDNGLAAIHLASHFFFKKEYPKAKILAEGVLNASAALSTSLPAAVDRLKTEAQLILAKIAHATGEFLEASNGYQAALRLVPNFPPALYGLGQCLLARNDLEAAATTFQLLLDSAKISTLPKQLPKIVALLLTARYIQVPPETRGSFADKTKAALKQALSLFPEDKALLQAAATVFAPSESELALSYLNRLSEQNESLTNFALLNNHAVLKIRHKQLDGAEELLAQAKSLLKDPRFSLFLAFNSAVLLDESGRFDEADVAYKSLLDGAGKSFAPCHLRLGILALRRGQLSEAADHFKDALGIDEKSVDAWNCLAVSQLKQKAFNPARKAFERVLQHVDKYDQYSLVSLGNLNIELARVDKNIRQREDYLKRAGEFLCKAIGLVPSNPFAAQGLAIIMAEAGAVYEAKDVFAQVKAAMPEREDTTLNLAHSLTDLGQPAASVALYEAVIGEQRDRAKRHVSSGKFVTWLLFAARARLLLARLGEGEASLTAVKEAIADVRSCLELLPSDQPLKFNLTLLLIEQGLQCHRFYSHGSSISKNAVSAAEDFALAQAGLEEALNLVKSLERQQQQPRDESSKDEAKALIDPKLLLGRRSQCADIRKQLDKLLQEQERQVREQSERLAQLKLHRETQQRQAIEHQAQKEAIERMRATEIDSKRRELAAQMQLTEEKVRAAARRRVAEGDSDGDGNENGDRPEKATTGRKRVRKGPSPQSEEEEEEDDTDGIIQSSRRIAGKSSALSKDYISDDEGEENVESEAVMTDSDEEEDSESDND